MKKSIFPYELIGEEVEIFESKNASHLGLRGKIIDETKSTIIIDHNGIMKTLLKSNITIKMVKDGKLINGISLVKRPEERIKG